MKTGCLILQWILNCIFLIIFKVRQNLLYSNKSEGTEIQKRGASQKLSAPEMESEQIFTDSSVDSTSVSISDIQKLTF